MATVMPHGVLFRGGDEKKIRAGIVQDDLLEAVIGLGPNLFYGTGIPACILVLRQKVQNGANLVSGKPKDRQGKVLFINADREYFEGRAQNFKAQVVANSRLAAIRYVDAFERARTELLAEAEALPAEQKVIDEEELCKLPRKTQSVIQAWRSREVLRTIEFAAVISGSNNDDPVWKEWTDGAANEQRIKRFKKPLFHQNPQKQDALAFLVVKSMLLTGFDAPIEGVMYLDRSIREAELLQAIARVNRTGSSKRCGIVVDYYGVAAHLRDALKAYAAEDIEGALQSLKDEIPALRDRHRRVTDLFSSRSLDLEHVDDCVDALADEKFRAEFTVKLKQFLSSLDTVLPRPEGLPFTRDAKVLAYLYARARNRYKDTPVLGKDVGAKVRSLIDEHVISLGVDPRIPPVSLTDADFGDHLLRQANDRAKASEMEHAIRSHIRKHLDEDPILFRKLSERLDEILKTLADQWDALLAAMQGIIADLRSGGDVDGATLPDLPEHYLPFSRMMLDSLPDSEHPSRETLARVRDLSVEVVDMIVDELTPSFWEPHRLPAQQALGSRIFGALHKSRMFPVPALSSLKDRLLELARANQQRLLGL